MADKSTEKALMGDNTVVKADASETQENQSPQSGSRRFALSASVMGGLAALLAACGKYTTKYDKPLDGRTDAKGGGPINPSDKDSVAKTDPGPADPKEPVDPNPANPPNPPNPPVLPPHCVDTSKATPKQPTDLLITVGMNPAFVLYGTESSALLALKFKSSGAEALSVGDRVHVLARKDGAMSLLATRVISPKDLFKVPTEGYGLSFESLDLRKADKIEILVNKTAAKMMVKMEFPFNRDTSFMKSIDGVEVVDLSIVRKGNNAEIAKLNAFEFGKNAPSMAGTTSIGSGMTLGEMFGHGGSYVAATSASTFSMASVTAPSGNAAANIVVQTIFGETVAAPGDKHIIEHQSVVVYARRTSNDGKNTSAYVRYFLYIG